MEETGVSYHVLSCYVSETLIQEQGRSEQERRKKQQHHYASVVWCESYD